MPRSELQHFRANAQLVFQDPYASLNPRMTIGDALDEPQMLHTSLSKAERRERRDELLAMVGLKSIHARRYPQEFSGGQRQRIAIARAIAASPKLVVCDEPVSALDVSIRAQILNLLSDLQQRLGLALIFISHDLSVVKHIADRTAVMYLGRIVETARTATLFTNPRHPYTQALMSAVPVLAPVARQQRRLVPGDPPSPLDPPTGCHLHPRCAHADEVCRTRIPTLLESGEGHSTACHHWTRIGGDGYVAATEAPLSPTLARLIEAFRPAT